MLKQRVITGALLIALVLWAVLYSPNILFAYLSGVVFLLAAWEWARLSSLISPSARFAYVVAIALLFFLCWYLPAFPVIILAVIFWLFALFLVLMYPQKQALWRPPLARMIMGGVVLAPSWLAINALRASVHGDVLIIVLFLLVWAADIGAYFSGRFWGKRPLMPHVSPKKTWEGFFGGLVLSLLIMAITASYLPNLSIERWFVLLFGAVLINIYSVTGDLFESLLKRYCQVKDSGKMLPGHGGVMDRIDSLTAAAPLFLLGLIVFWY